MKKLTFIATMLISIILLAAVVLYLNVPKPTIGGIVSPQRLPSFQLTDHNSQIFTEQNLKSNQWKVLFFGYTHCPDICPTTLGMLQAMKKQLNEKHAKDTQFIFISFDEERDSPAVLKGYLNFFDPTFLGLSGKTQQAEQLIKMLRVVYLKVPNKDSYLIDHTATLYLINPQGEWVASFNPPFEPIKLSQQYQKIRNFLGEHYQ
jgi:protein SCO1